MPGINFLPLIGPLSDTFSLSTWNPQKALGNHLGRKHSNLLLQYTYYTLCFRLKYLTYFLLKDFKHILDVEHSSKVEYIVVLLFSKEYDVSRIYFSH